MSVTKRSISGIMSFDLSSVGIELSATNAGVISSNTFQVAHAVFLPLTANDARYLITSCQRYYDYNN
jgi:hypothetical protein